MPEKWIDKRGFLQGYVKNRNDSNVSRDEDIVLRDDGIHDDAIKYGVPYYPVRCPQCGSKNQLCYNSKLPVRYHKCRDCGSNFKSTERDA